MVVAKLYSINEVDLFCAQLVQVSMSRGGTGEEDIVLFEHDTEDTNGPKQEEKPKSEQPVVAVKPPVQKNLCTTVHHSFGFASFKRNNIHFIRRKVVMLGVGNTLHFYDLNNQTYQFIEAEGSDGIGAIVVHPNSKYIAVGEKGNLPRVFIYEVDIEYVNEIVNGKETTNLLPPKLRAHRILERGTMRAYSAMSFNNDGTKLATVGSSPDYMLTIWNWETQSIILRYKAFGQEVLNVSFSQNTDGQLTTSGTGHIKFWKMAETFTGLKLQGQIGKFGKIDISDIAGYVELPDGKVLSGSEQGNLLLWEGNLIKCVIVRVDGKPCHDGAVEVVLLDPKTNMFITAGADGQMRYWDFEAIDTREPDENGYVYLEPVMQVLVGEGVKIIALARPPDGGFWIVQDANGALWRVSDYRANDEQSGKSFVHMLYSFHAGSISGAATSPYDHHVVTAGIDGTVRLYDYQHKLLIYFWRFSAGATCILWNPTSVDSTQNSLTVGFKNGVFRVIKRCEDNFELLKVSKPHTAAITAIAYSQNGEVFVTSSRDSTIFFFDVRNNYRPFGFVKTDSIPTCMAYKADDATLLVGFENGRVCEYNASRNKVLDYIDSSQTYEFSMEYKVFHYHYILKPPPKKVKNDKNEEIDVLDMDALMHDKPRKVRKVLYSDDGTSVIISLEKNEEETSPSLFEFYSLGSSWLTPTELKTTTQEPEWPKKIISSRGSTCSSIGYSRSHAYMVLGFDNGKISLVDFDLTIKNEIDREKETHALHDGFDGAITQAVLSFDDSFLITVSADGCFFVQQLREKDVEESEKRTFDRVVGIEPDITDVNYYSIQQARIQLEEEKKKGDAQKRKDVRIDRLNNVRKKFLDLVGKNEKREQAVRLSRDELQIDLQFQENMKIKLNERLEAAKREAEWHSMKVNLRLKKLKDHFINPLKVERIVLTAFSTDKKVCSFKKHRKTPLLKEHIKAVHEIINEELSRKNRFSAHGYDDAMSVASEHQSMADDRAENTYRSGINPISTNGEGQKSASKKFRHLTALEKAEDLQRQREQRFKLRHDLMQRQPSDTEEDQEVMQEILYCQQNMGDYKLKTDADYMVPEQQRVTAEKKLRQMILLEESMHTLRRVFNTRLLGLRDLKSRLITKFQKYNESIISINRKLGIKEKLVEYSTKSSTEYPENRENISAAQLAQFEREKNAEQRRQERLERQKSGMGTNLEDDDDDDEDDRKSTGGHSGISKRSSAKGGSVRGRDTKDHNEQEHDTRIASITLSEIENAEKQMEHERLLYEKKRLLRKQEKQIQSFDLAIEELRRERFKLASDLKNADIKLLLLYHEYEILKDFEIKDNSSFREFQTKKQAKISVLQKIEQCHEKLAQKKSEIGQLVKQEQLMQEFQQLVPTSHPAYAELLKLFKKSNQNDEGGDSDDEDNDSDDDSSDEEEETNAQNGEAKTEEKNAIKDDDEKRPDNCEPKLFEQVMHLRKRRIDQERLLDSIVKGVDVLKKERDALQKKEAIMNSELKKIETSIINTQRDKQNKLNELQTIVVLKLSQIQSLMQKKIPLDLSEHVVFTNRGLEALADRIRELKEERKALRKKHIELQKDHRTLVKEQKQKELEYQMWKEKVKEVQLLKFGRVINLEELEKATVDMEAEELKNILSDSESEAQKELVRWDQKLNEYKERLTKITNENTELLKQLAQLRTRQQALENELDASQNSMVSKLVKGMKKNVTDKKQELEAVIREQQEEIAACEREIQILCHKTAQ
jgi:WD40 repeat protein